MVEQNTEKIAEALREALKPVLGDVSVIPSDITHANPSKINVRVRSEGWSGEERQMGSGQPAYGLETLSIGVSASWQKWDHEKIKPWNRKVISTMKGLGWNLLSVGFQELGDDLETLILFDAVTQAY